MALLIGIIRGKVAVTQQKAGKVWQFEGQNFVLTLSFSKNPGAVKEEDFAKREELSFRDKADFAEALKELLSRARALWGEDSADRDDIVHDRRTAQILDNRRKGKEIGLPYNNQKPKEHHQIRNFVTLLSNLSGLLSDTWVKENYPQYADSLRNIRKILAWTYGKSTGAFLRCEMIAGKKRLGVPLEVYHDSGVEPYYAARDKDGRIVGRGTGHGV
ncbi:MAG: hypothetical protein ACE5OR_04485 [bacterium]